MSRHVSSFFLHVQRPKKLFNLIAIKANSDCQISVKFPRIAIRNINLKIQRNFQQNKV